MPKYSKETKDHYLSRYFAMCLSALEEIRTASSYQLHTSAVQKFVFRCVRFMNAARKKGGLHTLERCHMEMFDIVLHYIEMLTPRQLLTIFPVEKVYDGDKYGFTDYFTIMAELTAHGLDQQMGKGATDLLFEYVNRDIRSFTVGFLVAYSKWRREDGYPGLFADFSSSN